MISEREAIEMFGEGVVGKYRKEIEDYRKKRRPEPFDEEWNGYVSLPFLVKRLGIDVGNVYKASGTALVLVHPGYSAYSETAKRLAEKHREELGDYEREYLAPLKERICEARSSGERIIVYTPICAMKGTLDVVGGEGLLLVPTDSYDSYIEEGVLGVSFRELLGFLADSGLKDIELCGEWAIGESDGCLGHVERIISKPEYGFNVRRGIKYPLREADVEIPLFKMTKEEAEKFDSFSKSLDEWTERTYSQHLSNMGLEKSSCAAKVLKEVIELVGDDYIHTVSFYASCNGYSKEEVDGALDFLEGKAVLKRRKAADVLSDEIDNEFREANGSQLTFFNMLNRLARKTGLPESDEVVIPMIECELLK